MCAKTVSAIRVLVIAASLTAAGGRVLRAQATARISVDSQGAQANHESWFAVLSSDGRFVAFESDATNLVPGDTNGWADVFVHDRLTGETTRVSVTSQGAQANLESFSPAITADGRFVAFASIASNLVPGDTNKEVDIFVHDRQSGETTRVSVDSQGLQANSRSVHPDISGDGRFVAFNSRATNLVPGDTNDAWDYFVHDRQTGQTTRVSVNSQGEQANDDWVFAEDDYSAISADGRFVAFPSVATNLVPGDTNDTMDVFVHDRETGETTRVSVDSQGNQGNFLSTQPDISADGRFVAFDSGATNLVPGDTNFYPDIFVHDRQTGETTRVSVSSQGDQVNDYTTQYPSISADGRFVTFESGATNLVPGDTNSDEDIFLHDRQTGETTRASVDSHGGQADSVSYLGAISADGRVVAFASFATNLVRSDTNAMLDVFVHDRLVGPCASPALWSNYGSGWPGTSGVPGIVASSNPVLCTTVEIAADNSVGRTTPALFLAGDHAVNRWTPWGGTVLVLPALMIPLPMPAGGLSITTSVPCDDSLCGLFFFVQILELDAGASHGISFTPGLELRLGSP